MSSLLKYLIAACLPLVVPSISSVCAAAPGFLEGHLKIISLKEVELEDANAPTKTTAGNYADYPLIILNRDGKQEIARVNADGNGNYRVELPPGDYVLDVQRQPRGRVRATPQPFTVVSGQTIRVDMSVDTVIR